MVKDKQGTYAPKQNKVVVLWDLDNKPPRGPPYNAALSLKTLAQHFGDVVDISAYANRHAFIHLPQWVLDQRRERKNLDILERKGVVTPSEPYVCNVCGRKCKTNFDLKKHFKQLHQRERQKKLNRLNSLKGKKRQRYKERFIRGNHKYNEAARALVTPKVGYGLASELRRAGVFVKTVEDKPQAADWALKRQMQHSMSRGIDWLFLVSDDSDFSEMLRRAREANLGTVVVGDMDRALGRHADLWVPWLAVENGEISEKDLVPKNRGRREDLDGLFLNEDEELEEDFISLDFDGFNAVVVK
ncbi:Zinc finger C2H2-type [Sesbania bispinosa]|nr:Zinc finger C2H2-type [Sesbania bispinosa]